MRHGEAGQAASDELRCLTEHGRQYVQRAGAVLLSQPEAIDVIITSPLVRAVQTADLVSSAMGLDAEICARPEIASPSRLDQILDVIDEAPAPVRGVMVVGHEPTMGVLTEHLLGRTGVRFRTGTILVMKWKRSTRQAVGCYVVSGHPPARIELGT